MAARKKNQFNRDAELKSQPMRMVPPVDECLRAAELDPALGKFAPAYLRILIRHAQAGLREKLGTIGVTATTTRASSVAEVVRMARESVAADEPSLRTVVNATGIVLHTN